MAASLLHGIGATMKRMKKQRLSLSTETLQRVAGGQTATESCPVSYGPECPTRMKTCATCPTWCVTYCGTNRKTCALCPTEGLC
jgi:hypothetical protein